MLIVMPIAIPIAFGVTAQQQLTGAEASALLSACVASVLSGAIFGDHCSPITDTTILSSIGTGCNNIDHVKTQLPYALTVAGISAAIGTLPAGFGLPPWGSILAGAVCCVAVWFIFGKKPDSFPMEHL
jgi:Na+/H+ antiporter NhaC